MEDDAFEVKLRDNYAVCYFSTVIVSKHVVDFIVVENSGIHQGAQLGSHVTGCPYWGVVG